MKIAFMFPGQGTQFVGMGETLYKEFPVARKIFQEANEVLGFDLKKKCFQGGFEQLSKVENMQPAILTTSLAIARTLEEQAVVSPNILMGHSFGELTALTYAGVIDFPIALKIAQIKGEAVRKEMPANGGMLAIRNTKKSAVQKACKEVDPQGKSISIGMFNSPSQLVITGERSFLDEVAQKLSSQGASVETLKIEAPFHSLLLSKAASRVRTQLKELTFHPAKYEVISGLTGKPYKNLNSSSAKRKEEVVDNLSKQLTHPILWDKAMQEVHKKGIDTLLEISPRSLLIPLIEENSLNATSYPVRSGRDIKKVGKELGLNREEKIDILKKCLKIIVSTPNYNSKDEEYEKGVVKSYKKIQDMWLEAEKKKQPLSFEEVLLAVNMLHSALEAKKLSSKEHRQCLEELVDEKNKEIINRSEFKNVKK